MEQKNDEALTTTPGGAALEDAEGTDKAASDTKASLEDPETYDAYQEAMGELGDGDEAASMGGPAI